MSANEAFLILLMQNFRTRYQRVLVLEKYVQHYGPLSQDAEKIARELVEELDNDTV